MRQTNWMCIKYIDINVNRSIICTCKITKFYFYIKNLLSYFWNTYYKPFGGIWLKYIWHRPYWYQNKDRAALAVVFQTIKRRDLTFSVILVPVYSSPSQHRTRKIVKFPSQQHAVKKLALVFQYIYLPTYNFFDNIK